MSAAAGFLILAILAVFAIFLVFVLVYVLRSRKEFDSLVEKNAILEIENIGLGLEVQKSHSEIDARDKRIAELVEEVRMHRMRVESGQDRSWSEF